MPPGNEFFAVEQAPHHRAWAWRLPFLLVAIVSILAVNSWNWDHAEISGNYQGWLDDAATGKTSLTVHLQQIGGDVSGNCSLSKVYACKQQVRTCSLSGSVTGTTVKLKGELQGGGLLYLLGQPSSSSGEYKIMGLGHFQGTNDSSEDSPFMLKKSRL
ncbi:hypothetical protein IV102_02320 [bacterium]|nr:hypothetical protein [bacterium]